MRHLDIAMISWARTLATPPGVDVHFPRAASGSSSGADSPSWQQLKFLAPLLLGALFFQGKENRKVGLTDRPRAMGLGCMVLWSATVFIA